MIPLSVIPESKRQELLGGKWLMQWGVYRKIKVSGKGKGTGVGQLYQFIGISRNHYTGVQSVIYVPLRVDPDWAGTVRFCDIPRADFENQFEYVGEGLPDA